MVFEMHRGYVKIWRKVKDSGLYQLPETFTLFMFILTEATHQPRRVGSMLLQRGQYSSGRIELARQLKQSEQTIRTGLSRLVKLEILTIETTSHGSIYTVVNYSLYQASDINTNQPNNQPLTSEQPASNQPLTSEQPHNKHINTKNISTEEQKKKPSAEYSAMFIQFWDIWPSSLRKGGKSECYKIWKAKKLEDHAGVIFSHIDCCKSNGVWKDDQYIPSPKVYLGQARWDGAEITISDTTNPLSSFYKRIGA